MEIFKTILFIIFVVLIILWIIAIVKKARKKQPFQINKFVIKSWYFTIPIVAILVFISVTGQENTRDNDNTKDKSIAQSKNINDKEDRQYIDDPKYQSIEIKGKGNNIIEGAKKINYNADKKKKKDHSYKTQFYNVSLFETGRYKVELNGSKEWNDSGSTVNYDFTKGQYISGSGIKYWNISEINTIFGVSSRAMDNNAEWTLKLTHQILKKDLPKDESNNEYKIDNTFQPIKLSGKGVHPNNLEHVDKVNGETIESNYPLFYLPKFVQDGKYEVKLDLKNNGNKGNCSIDFNFENIKDMPENYDIKDYALCSQQTGNNFQSTKIMNLYKDKSTLLKLGGIGKEDGKNGDWEITISLLKNK